MKVTTMASTCKSCKKPVLWAETEATAQKAGKRIPLDVDFENSARGGRYSDGNLVFTGLRTADGTPIVRYVGTGPDRLRTHFVSCPNRDHHRRR